MHKKCTHAREEGRKEGRKGREHAGQCVMMTNRKRWGELYISLQLFFVSKYIRGICMYIQCGGRRAGGGGATIVLLLEKPHTPHCYYSSRKRIESDDDNNIINVLDIGGSAVLPALPFFRNSAPLLSTTSPSSAPPKNNKAINR